MVDWASLLSGCLRGNTVCSMALLASCCLQLPDVGVVAPAAGPDVGYTVAHGSGDSHMTHTSGDSHLAPGSGDCHMTSARVHPPAVVVRKRMGRPKKADAEVGVAPGCVLCIVTDVTIASPHLLVAQERGSSLES